MAKSSKNPAREQAADGDPQTVRIIGGEFRGRKLIYLGDPRTRPMKDRVREALFNLLGGAVAGKHAIDLFAGTGALGLEALSRGAARATLIEQHFPTARTVRQNAALLDVTDRVDVQPANVFLWARMSPPDARCPWVVFCSPPYAFYVERQAELLGLLQGLMDRAPEGSVFAVEFDNRFDPQRLPADWNWDVRSYPPAIVAIGRR